MPAPVCPSFEPPCADASFAHVTVDPVEPSRPICPLLGRFRDEFDFQLCRCEYENYQKKLFARAVCIAKRHEQMATDFYNAMVLAYNCRLEQDGCQPVDRFPLALSGSHMRMPSAPSCVSVLTDRRFTEFYEADACRKQVEALQQSLTRWAEAEAAEALRDAQRKRNDAIDRFNCYARAERLCL